MQCDTAEKLINVLKKERDAMMGGKYEMLSDFTVEKDCLIGKLLILPPDRYTLSRIVTALNWNARLLTAACKGVEAAQARLEAVRSVRDYLQVYNAAGGRETVNHRQSRLEKKV